MLDQLIRKDFDEALRRLAVIRPALIRVEQGVSVRHASLWISRLHPEAPSHRVAERWIHAALKQGASGLLPARRGIARENSRPGKRGAKRK